MREVELVVAWEWTCPECRAANFDRSVAVEVPPDDPVLKLLSDQADEAGLCMKPNTVTCKGCGTRFAVKADEPDDDDDDDEGEEWTTGPTGDRP